MSNKGQSLLSDYYPGCVCFVIILGQVSGERLQDHWSSGSFNFLAFCQDHSKSS